MANTILGAVRYLNRGAWSVTTQYDTYDVVTFEGSSWASIRSSVGAAPVEGVYWTLMAEKGDKGDTGDAATVTVGTVATGAAGTAAVVTNIGADPTNAVFNFTIPQGIQGIPGNVMYATFEIDTNGDLIMSAPTGYSGASFVVTDEGHLEVVVNG